jgi:hypothetical protein
MSAPCRHEQGHSAGRCRRRPSSTLGKSRTPRRKRSATPPSITSTPLGGPLRHLSLAERPEQKYAPFSAGSIFTCCNSYNHSRLFPLVVTARTSPTDDVALRSSFTWRRHPGRFPDSSLKLACPGRELFLGAPPAFSSNDSNNLSAYG